MEPRNNISFFYFLKIWRKKKLLLLLVVSCQANPQWLFNFNIVQVSYHWKSYRVACQLFLKTPMSTLLKWIWSQIICFSLKNVFILFKVFTYFSGKLLDTPLLEKEIESLAENSFKFYYYSSWHFVLTLGLVLGQQSYE